jgi:hypothetical protein
VYSVPKRITFSPSLGGCEGWKLIRFPGLSINLLKFNPILINDPMPLISQKNLYDVVLCGQHEKRSSGIAKSQKLSKFLLPPVYKKIAPTPSRLCIFNTAKALRRALQAGDNGNSSFLIRPDISTDYRKIMAAKYKGISLLFQPL